MNPFGDVEAAVVDILEAADLGADVAVDLIGYAADLPWLAVTRTGGAPTPWRHVDNPVVQVEARAPTKGAAFDLAKAARQAVYAARGVYAGYGLRLFDVDDAESGLEWSPDDTAPGAARYLFTLNLVTRPEIAP